MKSKTVAWLRRKLFRDHLNDWQSYHQTIVSELADLENQSEVCRTVLDVGSGRGLIAPFAWEQHPSVQRIGLDPDASAATNPSLQEFRLLEIGQPWPVANGSVDLALARYVLEHLENGDEFFAELNRVLKPGGRFVFLTPNRHHPSMLIAQLLSHSVKTKLLRLRSVEAQDVFPAHYRTNTTSVIRKSAESAGLRVVTMAAREPVPVGYLDFFFPGFLAALTLYGLLQWTRLEKVLGVAIIGVLEKPHETFH